MPFQISEFGILQAVLDILNVCNLKKKSWFLIVFKKIYRHIDIFLSNVYMAWQNENCCEIFTGLTEKKIEGGSLCFWK